jgi:catalase
MGNKGDKIADMARDTKEHSSSDRLTSDFGVKQANNDDWLRVTNNDHTGPSLLEDHFAREKVNRSARPCPNPALANDRF